MYEKVASLNVVHYTNHQNYLLFSLKLLFSKRTYLNKFVNNLLLTCQNCFIMLKFSWAMRYEYTYTSQAANCLSYLKIVYCSEHESQIFVNILFTVYKLCSFANFANFACRALKSCCTLSTYM